MSLWLLGVQKSKLILQRRNTSNQSKTIKIIQGKQFQQSPQPFFKYAAMWSNKINKHLDNKMYDL